MSCDETLALIIDRLKGLSTPADEQRLAAHLEGCAACRTEVAATEAVWLGLGAAEVEVPSARLRARFHSALAAHEAAASRPWSERLLASFWPQQPAFAASFAVALLLAGMLVGRLLPSSVDTEVAALRDEVRTVGLALLDHQSASERLLGVAWAGRTTQAPEVVDALLERVQYDQNLSVRLAAVEALRAQLAQPGVSAGLASALGRPEAPLLQVALADALLASGDSMAIDAVRAVLGSDELDPAVREYVETALMGVDTPPNQNTDA
ncbi:MAG TPA: HEAT repeat domain-containing protein [Gammaproteobacteria bacterium]|nr:HEAT repeat domain-containing protein [Gammaproteobacteria bacterium]